jgi:DNA-binding response OmpR family regulator
MEPLMIDATLPLTGRRRVLVVEDEIAIALEIEAELRDAGFDVVGPAGDVEEAASLIVRGDIDAAALDIGLLGRSVGEVMSLLVQRQIPFVVMTGYDDLSLPAWVPPAELVRKPCPMSDLIDSIRAIMARTEPSRIAITVGERGSPDDRPTTRPQS